MQKKALIIGTFQPWIDKYRQAFSAADVIVDVADPTNIVLQIDDRLQIKCAHTEFADYYDYIIPLEEDYEHLYYSFAIDKHYGQASMLNKQSILSYPNFSNKFYQSQLIRKYSNIRTPQSHYSINVGLLSTYVRPKPNETIAKITQSARGRGVFKLNSAAELIQLADEHGKRMLIQEFFVTRPVQDYRTTIVGYKSQGSIRRTAEHGYMTHGSGTFELLPDGPYVKAFCKLARNLGIEYCGIDYMLIDNEPVILEINRFAYMGEWKELVGTDIALNVVNHLQAG